MGNIEKITQILVELNYMIYVSTRGWLDAKLYFCREYIYQFIFYII